jgi:hypothetical protein
MEIVGRCRDDARSSIFGDDARSSMLEIDGLAIDWAVGGMRRERREREGRDRVNSRFFKLNFNLFSKKTGGQFCFSLYSDFIVLRFFIFRGAKNPPLRPAGE